MAAQRSSVRGRYLGTAALHTPGKCHRVLRCIHWEDVLAANLAIFYPHPQHSLLLSDVIAAAVILAAITMAVLYFHRARYLLVGWLFFIVTLVPVIGIVQVGRQAMADHYAYVPCIGFFP